MQAPQCAEMEALALLSETLEFSPSGLPVLAQCKQCILFSPLSAMCISRVDANNIANSVQHLNYCCGALRWPAAACSCGFSRLWPFFASRWDQNQTGLWQSTAPLLSLGRCSCQFCAHCLRVRLGPLPFSLKSIAFVICFDHRCGKAWNVFLMSLYAHRHERAECFRKGETLNLSWLSDPCGSRPTQGILGFCGLLRVKVALSRTNWCSASRD